MWGDHLQIIPSAVIEEMSFLKHNGLLCLADSWEPVGFCPDVKSLLSVADSVCLASQLVSGIWLFPRIWDCRASVQFCYGSGTPTLVLKLAQQGLNPL